MDYFGKSKGGRQNLGDMGRRSAMSRLSLLVGAQFIERPKKDDSAARCAGDTRNEAFRRTHPEKADEEAADKTARSAHDKVGEQSVLALHHLFGEPTGEDADYSRCDQPEHTASSDRATNG
jgi:hypothetical protein